MKIQKRPLSEQSFLYLVERGSCGRAAFQGLKQRSVKQPKGRETFQLLKQPAEHLKLFQPNAKSTSDLAFIIDTIQKYCHKFGIQSKNIAINLENKEKMITFAAFFKLTIIR